MKEPFNELPWRLVDNDELYSTSQKLLSSGDEHSVWFESIKDADYCLQACNNFPEAISLLKTLKEDAELALSGDWDKSDSGFEAQITLIDRLLNKIEV